MSPSRVRHDFAYMKLEGFSERQRELRPFVRITTARLRAFEFTILSVRRAATTEQSHGWSRARVGLSLVFARQFRAGGNAAQN